MVRLTEDMVIARAKTSDLESITKLNFWGSDLTDIGIVKQFKRAEILSFSLNQINSLAPFQYCKNLQELYIRRNDIRDLREVCYLQELPRLKRLLLSENPCCETAGDLYRPTIIRALPGLEMLDNEEVTPADREYALQLGLILEHPSRRKEVEKIIPGTRFYEVPDSGRSASTRYFEEMLRHRSSAMDATNHNKIPSSDVSGPTRPATALAAPNHQSGSQLQSEDQCRSFYLANPSASRTHSTSTRTSASPILEYYRHDYEKQRAQQQQHSHTDSVMRLSNNNNHIVDDYTYQHSFSACSTTTSAARSGKSSKNLVSAVICIINELDMSGLDLVEIAVKRRQNELSL